jgi:acetyl-CoA carboxylase carboxyl transferase beta subunit
MATLCEECRAPLEAAALAAALHCCPTCGFHLPMPARARLALLCDEGSVEADLPGAVGTDPLSFIDSRPYLERLEQARAESGETEAFVAARARIGGSACVVGAFDFRFLGGTLSTAVGERLCTAFEVAAAERRAVVIATASGGARMHEGTLALFQMARTSAARLAFAATGRPFVVLMTHPTMGGVAASFASLADVRLAEPGARIGFAGPRVVEQLLGSPLPPGFQRAEFLQAHGQLDGIVARADQRALLVRLVPLLCGGVV